MHKDPRAAGAAATMILSSSSSDQTKSAIKDKARSRLSQLSMALLS